MDHMYYYSDGTPILGERAEQMMLVGKEFEKDRHIGSDVIGRFYVSTVFLVINHSFGDGPPLLWETMVFDRQGDEETGRDLCCERYSSREEALEGHRKIVEAINNNTFTDYNDEPVDSTWVIEEVPTLI